MIVFLLRKIGQERIISPSHLRVRSTNFPGRRTTTNQDIIKCMIVSNIFEWRIGDMAKLTVHAFSFQPIFWRKMQIYWRFWELWELAFRMYDQKVTFTLKIYSLILAKPDNGSMYWRSSMSSLQLWSASAMQPHITDITILHKLLSSYYITNYINYCCNSSDLQLCNLLYWIFFPWTILRRQLQESIFKHQSQNKLYYILYW